MILWVGGWAGQTGGGGWCRAEEGSSQLHVELQCSLVGLSPLGLSAGGA